ncbi:MAG: reverse transcriptase family protein, partial [Candidatus Thiodiazotropha sp.]
MDTTQTDYSQVSESPGKHTSRGETSEHLGTRQPNYGEGCLHTPSSWQRDRQSKPFTGQIPVSCATQHTVTSDGESESSIPGEDNRNGNTFNSDGGLRGGVRTRVTSDSLSLVTLNVKNMKTNIMYLQSLAKAHSVILVQEHWLYAFESALAQQVFENSNYHIKCVDDLDPLPPTQPPRGRAGTAILWSKSLNHCINPLPDGTDRVIAVEVDVKPTKICLINVYLPARGSADCDIAFQATLDEIHEIFEKFASSHKVLLGGDFNSSLHRQESCGRDRMLKTFLEEHGLSLPGVYPVQPTYMHESTCANSQIDYWFVHPGGNESVTVGSQCSENLSDHVEVVLHTDTSIAKPLSGDATMCNTGKSEDINIKTRIRWDKCDLQLYGDILQTSLQKIEDSNPQTLLDIDLIVIALNKILYDASAASTPKKKVASIREKKNKLPVWNEHIEAAIKLSKRAHTNWKDAGSPRDAASPLFAEKKAARRLMRQTMRQQSYLQMQDKYAELMLAKEMDTRVFYKLVNQQRSSRSTATELLHFEGQAFSSAEGIAGAFSNHFKNLATPTDSDAFDKDYTNQVTFDKLLMESLAINQPRDIKPVTSKEVLNITRSFKTNKAQDVFGLSAEHLKNAPDILFCILANLMNSILQTGHVPPQLKQGILTPVLKKKKDATLPTNYRGITVLSIIGKVLERVLQNRTKTQIEAEQSKMQRGFTNNSSAVNAALIISETQNEAKDIGEPLKLVTLDACKAFDVVWQESLLRKIYNAGIDGNLWLCLNNLYSGAYSAVKWQGLVSPLFQIRQGVRQGGILSTLHYKLYNNDLLHLLESLRVGMSIGHIDCSCPTCADDVALLAGSFLYLQLLLMVVKFFICREHYFINAQKSAEVDLHKLARRGLADDAPTLGDDRIQNSASEVHLGVDRNHAGNVDIAARVQMGRRTMYAMMGAGAYGCSGVAPTVIAHLWKVFALPRMLYGLETYNLRSKDVQQLEQLQRSVIKRIQCLPINTATTAAYGLLGIRPIQQELDLRKLTLLG